MNNNEIEILLIEDNLGEAELTIRALTRKKIANKIVHLENGADAIDYLFCEGIYASRIPDNLPKLILLDLNMPKIGGIEVLQKIKSDEQKMNIPIVILTSSKEDPDIEKCYRLGANSYIVKPVEFDKFTKVVDELGFYWMLLNQPPTSII